MAIPLCRHPATFKLHPAARTQSQPKQIQTLLVSSIPDVYPFGMFRALLTIILMANLLACPLHCTSCDAAASHVDTPPVEMCSCCPQSSNSPVDSDPAKACECPDCLCHGATLQASVSVPGCNRRRDCRGEDFAMVSNFAVLNGSVINLQQATSRQISDRGICLRTANALIAFQHWLI